MENPQDLSEAPVICRGFLFWIEPLVSTIRCLSWDRARFEQELARAEGLGLFYVVIESNISQVVKGMYRSRMSVNAVVQSVAALSVRYSTPFLWCDDREAAETM